MTELLVADKLVKHYRLRRESLLKPAPRVEALLGVSFTMRSGTSLGIVGESGSGKSTLARLVMALEAPTSGSVRLLGQDLNALAPGALMKARRDFQMVFQDPYSNDITMGCTLPKVRPRKTASTPIHSALGASG